MPRAVTIPVYQCEQCSRSEPNTYCDCDRWKPIAELQQAPLFA